MKYSIIVAAALALASGIAQAETQMTGDSGSTAGVVEGTSLSPETGVENAVAEGVTTEDGTSEAAEVPSRGEVEGTEGVESGGSEGEGEQAIIAEGDGEHAGEGASEGEHSERGGESHGEHSGGEHSGGEHSGDDD